MVRWKKNLLRQFAIAAATMICASISTPGKAFALEPEIVFSFNPQALEAPESVATDLLGNKYVSLALTGEIRKIDRHGNSSTFAQLPLGVPLTPCGPFPVIMGALAIDLRGDLFIFMGSCDPATRGVYKISRKGEVSLLATFPLDTAGNGIATRLGNIFLADSVQGVIWKLSKSGGTPEVWAEGPLLDFVPNPYGAPGPNGIQFFGGSLYVANASTAQIVRIPLKLNGSAGTPVVHANMPNGQGCDDFAFDIEGSLYCTTDPFNTVVRVDQDGSSEVLLTIEDGLDGPTSTAFGRLGDRFTLYISNAAFPFFPNNGTPSILAVELDVPGYPLR